MRICVVGAGAIGGVLAYRLAASGHDVCVVARGAHLAAIQADGLSLIDVIREEALPAIRIPASANPEDLGRELGAQDAIFIALKSYDIAPMLPRLCSLLASHTMLIPAINGFPWWYFHVIATALNPEGTPHTVHVLDPAARMLNDFEPKRVIGCVVHMAAEVSGPGVIQHTGGARLVVGEPSNTRTERLEDLAGALARAGFRAEQSDDIRRDVWWKLLGNLSFNPVAAMHGKRMHEIVNDEAMLELIRPMIQEGMQVAGALGVHFDATADDRIEIARELGQARISMHQDLLAGRRLEIDALTKSVIELADALGIDVPAIRATDRAITALARAHGLYL
jgi:2-dehydropantoate 2-reductase